MSQSSPPFFAAGTIKDPRYFVGRTVQLRQLTTRMTAAQPTSINLVGESRIGKSSLLYHFYQTWEQRVQNSQNYVVIYLSMQEEEPKVENAFYRAAARELQRHTGDQTLQSCFGIDRDSRDSFLELLQQYQAAGVLPVICLDEFPNLIEKSTHFDDTVFNVWRGWMDSNRWMLIVASFTPLKTIREQHNLTSRFFNIGHVIELGDLTDSEAADLLRLPARADNQQRPILGTAEQQLALDWAGNHPYKLQTAAYALWEAGDVGHDVAWAQAQYERQVKINVPKQPINWRQHITWFLRWPNRLLRMILRLPRAIDEAFGWVFGWIVIIVLASALLGWLSTDQLRDMIINWLGILP